ncbi:MAG: hypothetical protein ACLQGP_31580 [Isosphaeraceae bacterium]
MGAKLSVLGCPPVRVQAHASTLEHGARQAERDGWDEAAPGQR